ncbi:MAG: hypothetical protein AMS22_01445 [Thiotrichales bacterium SG8_50]|nr:MAG: hypothetical protein AMS22_01445 [Thiotrichales bacterium SG8_50]
MFLAAEATGEPRRSEAPVKTHVNLKSTSNEGVGELVAQDLGMLLPAPLNSNDKLRISAPKVACVLIPFESELEAAVPAGIVLDLHLTNPNMAMRKFLSERNRMHGR